MHRNGRSGWCPPQGHTSILVDISGQIGEIRADVRDVKRRVATLEGRPRRPLAEYIPLIAMALWLAAATAGRVTWAEALPGILGLGGR